MITRQQAAEAFERYLKTGDIEDTQIVADYLTSEGERLKMTKQEFYDIGQWLKEVLKSEDRRMTNAEKYAEQIATLIASRVDGVCAVFSRLELLRCSICPLHGRCNDREKLKDWLLQEAS